MLICFERLAFCLHQSKGLAAFFVLNMEWNPTSSLCANLKTENSWKFPTPFKAVSPIQLTSKVKTLFQRPISIKNHQLWNLPAPSNILKTTWPETAARIWSSSGTPTRTKRRYMLRRCHGAPKIHCLSPHYVYRIYLCIMYIIMWICAH